LVLRLALLLPAATTMMEPAAFTSSTALWYEALQAPEPPKLMFNTRAGWVLAGTPVTGRPADQRIASTMSET
jgi:hypothetical protein